MKLTKLPAIAISAALGIVACSDDNGTIAQPENGTVGTELNSAGIDGLAGLSSGFEDFGNQSSGIDLNSSGSVVTSSNNTVASSGNVPASSNNAITSSNSVATSSNSVVASSNSGNPGGGENGDDENDNEDSRTLNGTQILLKLSGTSATVENNNGCVEVADKKATITCPGAYYVTGESSDFQVVVNTPGTENEGNTGIYLYNATIKSSNSPILVANADKTVLHLVKGTTNVVEDGNGNHLFTKVNGAQDTSKAAIYARDDLNIKGAGTLTVKGKFKNGIQCSNDLKIKNGVITVEAEENAVKGKGSLQISGGTLNLTNAKKSTVNARTSSKARALSKSGAAA